MPITILDGALIIITLISGLLAMVRGFSREVLAIISWIAAGFGVAYLYPFLVPHLVYYIAEATGSDWIDSNIWVANTSAGVIIFLMTLIIISLITARIADAISDSRIGALDRSLGFVFGAVRGIVLVVVALLFYSKLVVSDIHPQWVTQAKSKPLLDSIGELMLGLIPDNADDKILNKINLGNGENDDQDV